MTRRLSINNGVQSGTREGISLDLVVPASEVGYQIVESFAHSHSLTPYAAFEGDAIFHVKHALH
jgi:hypothetical protein